MKLSKIIAIISWISFFVLMWLYLLSSSIREVPGFWGLFVFNLCIAFVATITTSED